MDGLYWNNHLEMDENWGYPHDFGNLEFIRWVLPLELYVGWWNIPYPYLTILQYIYIYIYMYIYIYSDFLPQSQQWVNT